MHGARWILPHFSRIRQRHLLTPSPLMPQQCFWWSDTNRICMLSFISDCWRGLAWLPSVSQNVHSHYWSKSCMYWSQHLPTIQCSWQLSLFHMRMLNAKTQNTRHKKTWTKRLKTNLIPMQRHETCDILKLGFLLDAFAASSASHPSPGSRKSLAAMNSHELWLAWRVGWKFWLVLICWFRAKSSLSWPFDRSWQSRNDQSPALNFLLRLILQFPQKVWWRVSNS